MVGLPNVGGDVDLWGPELNAYLLAEHSAVGTHSFATTSLTDIATASLADGDQLLWVAGFSKWKNFQLPSRTFEYFGGSKTGTLTAQTNAWTAARSWSDGIGGGTVVFGPGTYQHMPPMELGNMMRICGMGMFATRLQADSTVSSGTALTRDGAHKWIYNHVSTNGTTDKNATAVRIEDMWLDMASVSGTTTDGIYFDRNPQFGSGASSDTLMVYNSAYQDMFHIVRNVWITRSPRDGIASASMGGQDWHNVQVYSAGRNGFRPGFDSAVIDCTAGFAGKEGFYIAAPPIRLVACKAFSSGNVTASNGDGFHITGISSASATLTNCEAQDNRAYGFNIDTNSNGAVSLVGSWADSNSSSSAGTYAGFSIYASPGTSLIGCRAFDRNLGGVTTQTHGLTVDAGGASTHSTGVKIVGFEHRAQDVGSGLATISTPFTAIDASASFAVCEVNMLTGFNAVGTTSGTYTPDFFTNGGVTTMTINGNLTVAAPSNGPYPRGAHASFSIRQDATGGRTITWNAVYVNTPTTVTTANAYNTARFRYDGTNWIGM